MFSHSAVEFTDLPRAVLLMSGTEEMMLKDSDSETAFSREKSNRKLWFAKIPFLNNMQVIIELEIFNGVGKALEFILVVIIEHFKLEVK